MRRHGLILTAILVLLSLQVLAVNPRDMTFPELTFEPTEPVRFVTDNGMVVYFLEYHELPIVTVSGYLQGGSVYDPVDKVGLADITAGLMRTGGAGERTPDQVDMDLEFVGASVGSGAQDDMLSVSMSALKKDAGLAFEIFSDVLIRPTFDPDKLALELSNTKNQILRQNDSPWDISRRVFYQTVFAGHPYAQYATLGSIDNITRDDVVAYHKRFYGPDNFYLAIAGDMTLEEAKATVKKYFGSWKKVNLDVQPPAHAATHYTPGVYYAEKDMNQANIRLGHLGIDIKNPDRFALEVMNFVLGGGGFVSRLTGQVRTTAGLAYSVGSYQYVRPYTGCWFGYCLTNAESMSKAVQLMLDIITEVKTNGITQRELDLARESILNSYVFDYDTPGEFVAGKAYLDFRGFPPDQMKRNIEAYKAVTLEDCKRVAARYLDTEHMAIVITGNKELFDQSPEVFGPMTAVSMEIK